MNNRQPMKSPVVGVSLVEYVLIGALVILLSIGVLMALGRNYDLALLGLRDDIKGNVSAAQQASTKAGAGTGQDYRKLKVDGKEVLPPPDVDERQLCFDGGYCLNIPVTVTAGSNGSYMAQYRQVLEQIIAQLEATPGADSQLLRLLREMNAELTTAQDHIKDTPQSSGEDSFDYKVCPPAGADSACDTQRADERRAFDQLQADFNTTHSAVQDYFKRFPNALPSALTTLIQAGGETGGQIIDVYTNSYHTDQGGVEDMANIIDTLKQTRLAGLCGTGPSNTQCLASLYP